MPPSSGPRPRPARTAAAGVGTGELTPAARARVLLAIAVSVVLVHLAQVLVILGTGGPGRVAVVVVTTAPWVATALWAVRALVRRTGAGPGLATAALTAGALGVTADGVLTGSPGQEVLCAVGLTGIALGTGAIGSPRSLLLASPVVVGAQAALVLVVQGTSPQGWFVTAATTTVTVGVLAVVSWVQAHRRTALAALAASALVDPLTGLLNRRGMADRFAPLREAAGPGQRVAVVALDLDRFKAVNDAFGHDAGDRVLVVVADVLRSQARADDLVVRLGGEELAWIGVWDDVRSAAASAERLRRAVAGADLPHGLQVTVSGGVAFSTDATHAAAPAEALSRLLVRADAALYRAKTGGRDRVEVAPAVMPSGADPHHGGAPAPQVRDGGSGAGARGAGGVGQRA